MRYWGTNVKHQFFADERDFLKYDLWIELADHLSEKPHLTFVPMLTGPDGTKQGGKSNYLVGKRRKCLYYFLQFGLCAKRRQRNADLAGSDLDSRAERLRQELQYSQIHDWSVYWIAQKKGESEKVGDMAFLSWPLSSNQRERLRTCSGITRNGTAWPWVPSDRCASRD